MKLSQSYFEQRARKGYCNSPMAWALAKKQEQRMNTKEILFELEDINTRVMSLHNRNKGCQWLCDVLHAVEVLLRAVHKTAEFVNRTEK